MLYTGVDLCQGPSGLASEPHHKVSPSRRWTAPGLDAAPRRRCSRFRGALDFDVAMC
jgi:hypothetical protein